MKLYTSAGRLKSGSAFKLFVISWAVSWGLLFLVVFAILILSALAGGQVYFNDEPVSGPVEALLAIVPFVILLPVMIGVHAILVGGLLTLGLLIYKVWRPVEVIELDR